MIKLIDPRESTIYLEKYSSELLPKAQAPAVKKQAYEGQRGSEVIVVLVFLSALATIGLGVYLLI